MQEPQGRKRANKKQQELLVERLHANIEMARDNMALREVIDFQAALSIELNQLGCSRTAQQWQHIWNLWVAKVKTKARKIRDYIRATGGGPAGAGLTEIEEKILEIVGSASIDGFGDLEAGMPPSPVAQNVPPEEASPPIDVLPSVEPNQNTHRITQNHTEAGVEMSPSNNRRTNRRRGLRPRPRPPVNNNLVESLNQNNQLLRDVISTASENIAGAMRDSSTAIVRAAEILAAAIQSAGVPVFIQQDENSTM